MEDPQLKNKPNASLSPWLIILFTAPIPLLILGFFFYRWYSDQSDFTDSSRKFVQRQNQVMAYDTLNVAREVTGLLQGSAAAVQSAALLAPDQGALIRFLKVQQAPIAQLTDSGTQQETVPLYNRLYLLDLNGNEILAIVNGKRQGKLVGIEECRGLCDRETRTRMLKAASGELRFGRLMRWYRPKDSEERVAAEGLTVFFRDQTRIVELWLDYRHLKSIMFSPTFPYKPRRDLLKSYNNGNYIYLVDTRNDILLHPKSWHVAGVDPKTMQWVAPVRQDSDTGNARLNVAEYQGEKLREYFRRLISKSFVQRSVDIFRAPNLGGTNRVLSVAPVSLKLGQYEAKGIFGHVIVGCNVDYFEEPNEQVVPYY